MFPTTNINDIILGKIDAVNKKNHYKQFINNN